MLNPLFKYFIKIGFSYYNCCIFSLGKAYYCTYYIARTRVNKKEKGNRISRKEDARGQMGEVEVREV